MAKKDTDPASGDVNSVTEDVPGAEHAEDARKAAREAAHAAVDEQHDRAEALASSPQKVTDGNETAALQTITGQVPERDLSDAPSPNVLGPHHSIDPDEDPAKINDPKGDG
jgi:hypothetical protein